jgi:hypothetical protein
MFLDDSVLDGGDDPDQTGLVIINNSSMLYDNDNIVDCARQLREQSAASDTQHQLYIT